MLIHLYKDTPFFGERVNSQTGFLDSFINELIVGLKKERSLSKIAFRNQKDREFFLALCTGKKHSLSLLTYVTVQSDDGAGPICIEAAHKELLLSFLDKKTYKALAEQEEKIYFAGRKIARLNKKEISRLLAGAKYSNHLAMVRFGRKRNYKTPQQYMISDAGHIITQGKPALLYEP